MRNNNAKELRDNRRRDVRHDSQGKNGQLKESATRQHVDEFVNAVGTRTASETRLNVREVDERCGNERTKTVQNNHHEGKADLRPKIGGSYDSTNCAEH